jgi:glucose/arabinose dehydrogenase
VAPDGSIFIADRANNRVRRVGPEGVITTVAGTGTAGFSGDGGPATAAALRRPEHIALAPDGSLFISDTGNHRLRRVTPDGVITTVAGTGVEGFQGDGGPAVEADLSFPKGIAVGSEGSVFVATSFLGPIIRGGLPAQLDRVCKVSRDGNIATVAGAPTSDGKFADGIPATQAVLSSPEGVALANDGTLFVADSNHNRIRRVSLDGLIETVAGVSDGPGFAGTTTFKGDEGPAIEAGVSGPFDVAVADDGTIYIADTFHHRIRRVAVAGVITTVAGTGVEGSNGDGGLPTAANIGAPRAVAVGPDGSVYFTDQPGPVVEDGILIDDQHRVRRIVLPLC